MYQANKLLRGKVRKTKRPLNYTRTVRKQIGNTFWKE